MVKVVRLRELAAADLADTTEYYRQEVRDQVALDFVDSVERCFDRIGRSPRTGSLHFAYELAIPELRASALQQFPYIVFYLEAPDVIDVWRVLHAGREIPAMFRPPEQNPRKPA